VISLEDTAPVVTLKLLELNEAAPIFDVLASSAEYVTVVPLTETSRPVPVAKVSDESISDI
jgi:hypothetical protein